MGCPEVSIVVVNSDTREWLDRCLQSLRADEEVEKEVIVVDNASGDGSAEMVHDRYPEVKLVRNPAKVGFAGNNRLGASGARAPVLLFLNPDTEVPAGSLGCMLRAIDEWGDEYGVFGPKILDEAGGVERSTGRFPTLVSILIDSLLGICPVLRPTLSDYSQRHYCGYDGVRPVDWVTGACLWIRRDVLEAIDSWDGETFFMYYEDVDLCYRAWQAGSKVLYVPHSVVYHYHSKTPVEPKRRKCMMRHGLAAFSRKHYGPLRGWVCRWFATVPRHGQGKAQTLLVQQVASISTRRIGHPYAHQVTGPWQPACTKGV